MFNTHKMLNKFYGDSVRLREKHNILREYRDKNVQRVRDGMALLREEEQRTHPYFREDLEQGSMAMSTINQAQNNDDHDIDHALIYDEIDCTADPSQMRELVARAVLETRANFRKDPEVQTNAVTIWYADDYHVDLAIFKRREIAKDRFVYFHAGESWTPRDPRAINDWFRERNKTLSPSSDTNPSVTVESGQLRRVVRLLKFWSVSRDSWSLPSGLILTALVAECFRPNNNRDDEAFLQTLEAIRVRLHVSRIVQNPTEHGINLTTSEKHFNQIESLIEKIEAFLPDLREALDDTACDETASKTAWSEFFRHEWWNDQLRKSENSFNLPTRSNLEVAVSYGERKSGRQISYDPWGTKTIPKNQEITFHLKTGFPPPEHIHWQVQNSGDEAKWANQIRLRDGQVDKQRPSFCYERTQFRGNHKVICSVTRAGSTNRLEIPIRIR